MGFALKMVGMAELVKTFKPIAASDTVTVVAKADHAECVEYGTSRMPAQPFAGPGTNTALAALGELEQKAGSLQELVMLLAQRMVKEWKKNAPVSSGELRDSIGIENE